MTVPETRARVPVWWYEIHGTNGNLIHLLAKETSHDCTDEYGRSSDNKARLAGGTRRCVRCNSWRRARRASLTSAAAQYSFSLPTPTRPVLILADTVDSSPDILLSLALELRRPRPNFWYSHVIELRVLYCTRSCQLLRSLRR
jgi:hypothetical protein